MAASLELRSEAVRSVAFGSVGASYTPIGDQLDKPIRIMMIQNLTDALLMFSFDGVNDHFPLPANGFMLLDVTTNRLNDATGFYISKGTQMQVKQVGVPTTGSVYLTTLYARGS